MSCDSCEQILYTLTSSFRAEYYEDTFQTAVCCMHASIGSVSTRGVLGPHIVYAHASIGTHICDRALMIDMGLHSTQTCMLTDICACNIALLIDMWPCTVHECTPMGMYTCDLPSLIGIQAATWHVWVYTKCMLCLWNTWSAYNMRGLCTAYIIRVQHVWAKRPRPQTCIRLSQSHCNHATLFKSAWR